MAITVVPKQDATDKFTKALGVAPSLVQAFQNAGGTIIVNGSNLVFTAKGVPSKNLSVPAGALSLLYNQMMNHMSKQSLLGQVTATMTAFVKEAPAKGDTTDIPIQVKDAGPSPKVNPFNTKPPQGFVDDYKPHAKVATTAAYEGPTLDTSKATVVSLTTKVCAKDQLNVAAPVKLVSAEYLLQPVKGSSAGSRYFCVALSDTVKMAVRIVHHTMSLRVEWSMGKMSPTEYKTLLEDLKENGFTVQAGSGHASIHLDCPNKAIALRTVGAMASGLKLPFLPDVIQSIL